MPRSERSRPFPRNRKGHDCLSVVIDQVSAPDAPERLRQACKLILRAAARAETEAAVQNGAPAEDDEKEEGP